MTSLKARVLIIDDDKGMRESLVDLLASGGFEAVALSSATDAEAEIERFLPDAILSDVRMPGKSGLELLDDLNAQFSPPLILISAHGDIPMAVEAIQNGAYSFLEKPFDPRRLLTILDHATRQHQLSQTTERLKDRLSDLTGLNRLFLGNTSIIEKLRESILNYARLDASVILVGETGTGKDLVARAIHDLSPRSDQVFKAINCAAIPSDQFEEFMFGREQTSSGIFHQVHGGSLFLDNVSAASIEVQSKLLRVIEDRRFTPLGGMQEHPSNFRLIATFKDDPSTAIQSGSLREDLYFRIQELELHLPSLRDHKDDISILFTHFMGNAALLYDAPAPALSPDDLVALLAYDWPGNVRELQTIAGRFVLSAQLGTQSIASLLKQDEDLDDVPNNLRGAVAAFERTLIARAIKANEGRMDETADALGIGRRTLNEKIVKLGLDKDKILKN